MTVSSATSQEVRRTKLASLFINLISDPSRWVREFFPLPWTTALRMFVCVDIWDFFFPALESEPGSLFTDVVQGYVFIVNHIFLEVYFLSFFFVFEQHLTSDFSPPKVFILNDFETFRGLLHVVSS